MRQEKLGTTDIDISVIGLGCMGMSHAYGPSDRDQSLRVLEHALDVGINFYDTADMYGRGANEELLSGFLKDHRDRVVLASKCGIVQGKGRLEQSRDTSPAYIAAACDASLKRLGTDRIDLYYLHRLDGVTPIEESMGALQRLHDAGKIRAAGLSEVTPEQLRQANAAFPVSALQSEYSLATHGADVEAVIETCGEVGTTFVAFSPLSRGLLTGAYRGKGDFAETDFRAILPRFQEGALEANLALVDRLAEMAAAKGATPGQIALAYVLSRAPHMTAIPGTRRTERLEENAGAAAVTLSDDERTELERLFAADAVQGARYPDQLRPQVAKS